MSARTRTVLGFVVFFGGYIALIAWFKLVDVYHTQFATTGALVVVYNFFRLLLVFYLFWIIHCVGTGVLLIVNRAAWNRLVAAERLALGFSCGAGVWHVALLALGYLRLYTVPVAVALTLPIVALSFPSLLDVIDDLRKRWVVRPRIGTMAVLAAAVISALAAVLLMVKGLYPGGGSDYFSHYFYYYQTVVDRGDIWPNRLWYHYYESQGAGLFFLGMLLSDPLAPQLVTTCFFGAAALVIYLMARDAAPGTAWPLVAVMMFLAIYIHTPIWAQFEKQHEINAALVLAVAWISARGLARAGEDDGRMWIVAAVSAILAAVIVTHVTAIFLGASFGLLALGLLLKRKRAPGLICVGLAAVAGLALAGLYAIDYWATGMMDDRPLFLMWRLADVEKLAQWGALPMVVKVYWGLVGMVHERLPLRYTVSLVIYSLRVQLLFPLVGCGVLIAIAALRTRFRTGQWGGIINAPFQIAILLTMLTATAGFCLTNGRVEPLSFYRYSSYAVPLMIAAAISLCALPLSSAPGGLYRAVRSRYAPPVIFVCTFLLVFAAPFPTRTRELGFGDGARFFNTVLPNAARFAAGTLGIDQAYTRQVGWPDKPWGAIYPGARGAYAVVGPRVPIWSMHTTSFCMLPDCPIDGVDSFLIGRGMAWVDLMFGSPEEGRAALQASGRNFFLISSELSLDDNLPRSALFAPDNIDRYLGVRWSDGTTTLLTWLGPGIARLDPQWVARYRRMVEQSAAVQSFPYDDMRAIFARLKETPHPWQSFELPWHPR